MACGSPAHDPLDALLGRSDRMRALRSQLAQAARVPSTLLLCGETGTGKGLAARALHARSPRAAGPFVHVDCAALSPALVESELFGHERGAFTGAAARRAGRFELAAGGTLLLDEVGELAPPLQAKLLRVLQDRVFERVGGVHTLRLDARIVAATHRDLRAEVAAGRFRADLFYRLDVLALRVPPLRERREDVPLLVHAGLARFARALGLPAPRPTPAAVARLARRPWPGNVRELENLLERLVVRVPGARLEAEDLDPYLRTADGPPPPEPCERIAQTLRATRGNVAAAARRLGLPRTTLRHRMQRYGIQADATSRSATSVSTPR